jgi:hypothetical protein
LAVNDVVEIFAYTAFTVANAYTKSETDGVAAAAAGLRMVVPTSVAVGSGSGSVDAIGNVTFSGASSISLNGCFTSTYDNYHISLKLTPSTAITATIRFRTNGTDNSSSTYKYIVKNFSSAGADETYISRTGTSSELNRDTGTTQISWEGILRNPMLAIQTHLNLTGTGSVGNYFLNATSFDNTTTFDGFSLIASTGNITGSIRVYGYKD